MGRLIFVLFPLLILGVDIIMQGGNLTGTTQSICLNTGQTSCVESGSKVTFSCPAGGNPCVVPGTKNCVPLYPPPAYCFKATNVPGAPFGLAAAEFINPGVNMTTQAIQVAGQGVFNFGAIGADGVITMIIVAISVAAIAGLTILGTGLNQASIKILFLGGLLVGLWVFFASVEGFVAGSTTSWFTQLNATMAAFKMPPFGTIAYIVMTVFELLGIASFISGGDSG